MRTKRRRFGRDRENPRATGATHVIKIGYDARKPGKSQPFPGKLPGFLICRDTLDAGGNLTPDHAGMKRIDKEWSPAKLDQAKREQLKGSTLPRELRFVITHDASRTPDGWSFPSTFSEAYECWNKNGLFCYGDGLKAHRKQENGSRADIDCLPMGCECEDGENYCEFSINRECRAQSRLVLCLFAEGKDGKPEPASPDLGWEARYRFDTTSEYNAMRIGAELEAAAERLNGNLSGITGILAYQIQKKRTGNSQAPMGLVGQVMIALNEMEIRTRESQQWGRQLEMQRAQTMALPAPAAAEGGDAKALPEMSEPTDPFARTPIIEEPEEPEEPEEAAFSEPEPAGKPEPEPEPEPESDPDVPLKVEYATDEELSDALGAFAADHLEDYAWFDYQDKDGNSKRKKIDNIDWFFEGQPGKRDETRRTVLRDICQRLEDNPDSTFELLPRREAKAS